MCRKESPWEVKLTGGRSCSGSHLSCSRAAWESQTHSVFCRGRRAGALFGGGGDGLARFRSGKTAPTSSVFLGPWHWHDPGRHFPFSHACTFPLTWDASPVLWGFQEAWKGDIISHLMIQQACYSSVFNPRIWNLGRTLTIPSDSPWAREKGMQTDHQPIPKSLWGDADTDVWSVGDQDFSLCLSNGGPETTARTKKPEFIRVYSRSGASWHCTVSDQ